MKVYLNASFIGELTKESQNKMGFTYDSAWCQHKKNFPLSLSLPLNQSSLLSEKVEAYFAGLLPEADIRRRIAKKLGVSEKNDFSLLAEIGRECIGAVSLGSESNTPLTFAGKYQKLSSDELNQRLKQKSKLPLIYQQEDAVRLSLAGVQEKTALYFDKNQWYLPQGMSPSSHIIKPQIEGFALSVENEAFCMQLAQKVGLPVPETAILNLNGKNYFVIRRYDRKTSKNGLLRLHQEDFCQALGIHPLAKYENEGGPGLKDCFDLISQHSLDPLPDKINLFFWVVFNYCLGNADAHGKNLAWYINENGFKLAPFYDILSTAVYPDHATKQAMRIGGENRPAWIYKRHWEKFAEDIGMNKTTALRLISQRAKSIQEAAQVLAKSFGGKYKCEDLMQKILKIITGNLKKLQF